MGVRAQAQHSEHCARFLQWNDYVPSESNPADAPSRFHAMSRAQLERAVSELGDSVRMIVPELVDPQGRWLSSVAIAQSLWLA